jgi:hypothetical protein
VTCCDPVELLCRSGPQAQGSPWYKAAAGRGSFGTEGHRQNRSVLLEACRVIL